MLCEEDDKVQEIPGGHEEEEHPAVILEVELFSQC